LSTVLEADPRFDASRVALREPLALPVLAADSAGGVAGADGAGAGAAGGGVAVAVGVASTGGFESAVSVGGLLAATVAGGGGVVRPSIA
jgi:hypothetical protein